MAEIDAYNMYLAGDIWCVRFYDKLPDMETFIDSGLQEDDIVCNYYGKETAEEAASEMACIVLSEDADEREILKAIKEAEKTQKEEKC